MFPGIGFGDRTFPPTNVISSGRQISTNTGQLLIHVVYFSCRWLTAIRTTGLSLLPNVMTWNGGSTWKYLFCISLSEGHNLNMLVNMLAKYLDLDLMICQASQSKPNEYRKLVGVAQSFQRLFASLHHAHIRRSAVRTPVAACRPGVSSISPPNPSGNPACQKLRATG